MNRAQLVLARFDDAEYRLCRGLNRAAGWPALRPALIMMATGLAGLLIYRRLKSTLVRERPFMRHPAIRCMRCASPGRPWRTFQCSAGYWCPQLR